MDTEALLELTSVLGLWGIANVVFRGYEAHVPWPKRVLKLLVILALLATIRLSAGRLWFYLCLAGMSGGIAVLHGWWFHRKHGIHWRTAEPRDAYFRLIGRAPPSSEY